MKIFVLHLIMFISATIFFACSKNDLVEDEVRISEIHRRRPSSTDTIYYTLIYNGAGQITRNDLAIPTTGQMNTFFNVTYSGNEIIMSQQVVNTSTQTLTDTIRLFMDGNNKLIKRLHNGYLRMSSNGVVDNSRSYIFDTTLYQYDPGGFLVKEIQGHFDSIWRSGASQTTILSFSGENNHSISNGNAVSVRSIRNTTYTVRTATSSTTENYVMDVMSIFGYTQGYKNKFDFSNAAVLNEMYLGTQGPIERLLPLDRHYMNLPDKITRTQTKKSLNGTVISVENSIINYQNTYNAKGYRLSFMNVDDPRQGFTFYYKN